MKTKLLLICLSVSLISVSICLAQAPNLGTASTFALFTANGAFANNGASTVTGDIGTNVGALSGFPPGTVSGQTRLPGSTQADQASTDVTAAYTMLSQLTCTTTILAELGGQTLSPGVHCQPTANATSLNGTLTLSGAGIFVIKLNSALTTATNSTISLINGASACDVYFQVNGAVGLGTGSSFKGTILAAGAISLGTNASLEGRGLSTAGAIALNNNVVAVTNSVLAIDVTVGTCSPATNLYSISGNISSTNAPAATVTVTDGIVSTTVIIGAGETSTPYSLTGLMSGTGGHTVKVSCAGNIDSATYVAPASCTTSPASLAGMVYSDNNGNGVSDGGDTPIAGVMATLLDSTGAAITSTTTSGAGLYSFPGLIPGVPYSVSFTTPIGFSATTPTVAGPVTLAADENNTSLSAGFQPVPAKGSLGDFVWQDLDDNGQQDNSEPGVEGVTIELYRNGVPFTTDTTDAQGKYTFAKLDSASYYIKVVAVSLPTSVIVSSKPNAATVPGGLNSDVDPTTLQSAPVVIDPVNAPNEQNNTDVDVALVTKLIPDLIYDLALTKSIDKKLAMLGDTVAYTIEIKNEGEGTAHEIMVKDELNAGVQFVSSSANIGSYSSSTKLWSFDSLTVGASATLTITVRVIAQGVWFNTAEISSMREKDNDSTPGNGVESEDDIDRECFTVPILVCRGDGKSVDLTVPAQYQNVVWFRKAQNGPKEQVATGNSYTAIETELGSYEYTYTSTSGTCPAGGCCPIMIVVEDCCPPQLCVPVTVKKVKL